MFLPVRGLFNFFLAGERYVLFPPFSPQEDFLRFVLKPASLLPMLWEGAGHPGKLFNGDSDLVLNTSVCVCVF